MAALIAAPLLPNFCHEELHGLDDMALHTRLQQGAVIQCMQSLHSQIQDQVDAWLDLVQGIGLCMGSGCD